MCVKISIFDSAFREKCLVFLRKASKPLASSLALTPSFHTGAFVIHAHSQTLGEHTVSSLYLRAFHLWVFVCSSFAHVLCAYTHVTVLGVYASPLSCCVPNWLWHICGFSRRIRAGAKLPRNQCNRLRSPPLPSSSSLLLLPESAPLFLSVSVRLCLCSRLSFFLFFSPPPFLLRALIKNGASVCCIFKMVMDGFKRLMVFSVSSGSCYEPLSWLLWLEPDWLVSTH